MVAETGLGRIGLYVPWPLIIEIVRNHVEHSVLVARGNGVEVLVVM